MKHRKLMAAASRISTGNSPTSAEAGTAKSSWEKQHLKSDDWQRTLYINTLDLGTTNFDISDKKSER